MVDLEDASDHLGTDLTKDLTLKWRRDYIPLCLVLFVPVHIFYA